MSVCCQVWFLCACAVAENLCPPTLSGNHIDLQVLLLGIKAGSKHAWQSQLRAKKTFTTSFYQPKEYQLCFMDFSLHSSREETVKSCKWHQSQQKLLTETSQRCDMHIIYLHFASQQFSGEDRLPVKSLFRGNILQKTQRNIFQFIINVNWVSPYQSF